MGSKEVYTAVNETAKKHDNATYLSIVQVSLNSMPHLLKLRSLGCVLLQFMLLPVGYGQCPHTHDSVRVVSDPSITSGSTVTQQEGRKQPSNGVLYGNDMEGTMWRRRGLGLS